MTRPAVLQRQGGRRIKKVAKGERTQIGVIVGGKTKALLLKAMQQSGRTISREAEHLIEKALAYDGWLVAQKRTLEEMERGNVEAVLHRLGYPMERRIIAGKAWKAWGEPEHPGIQPSGFEPWKEGELKQLFPGWTDDEPPEGTTEITAPPLPPHLAKSDPDRLYLVWTNEGWQWEEAPPPAGAGKSSPSKKETP
jgi:hypothetical protein